MGKKVATINKSTLYLFAFSLIFRYFFTTNNFYIIGNNTTHNFLWGSYSRVLIFIQFLRIFEISQNQIHIKNKFNCLLCIKINITKRILKKLRFFICEKVLDIYFISNINKCKNCTPKGTQNKIQHPSL